ncbi:MAG: cytidine deaminase [Bacteroidales bacterium]|jgi:cytidine deaminase|nr:cytidine deaminase [Bacteroidales bacterium]
MIKTLTIEYEEIDNLTKLSAEDHKLVLEARKALPKSYSPYSEFKVASAVRFEDGEIIIGTNQENVAYPSGLCGERVALFAAGSDARRRRVAAIAVVAFHNGQYVAAKPCGACLQVMLETEKRASRPLIVIFALGNERFAKIKGVKNLMPFAFSEF